MRAIVTPPVLPPEALAELKQWLGVTTQRDDAPLTALLRAALDMCASFTGVMPIACTCEEVLPARSGWQALSSGPVLAITGAETLDAGGVRATLAPEDYAFEIEADGGGRIRLLGSTSGDRIAVRFIAGLAADWAHLPDAMRHGVVRMAAHQHRERETSGALAAPPASVAALWRPWRLVRLT